MPTIETFDGDTIRSDTKINKRADICLNPLGVINRLNPSQLIEQELNYISKVIRYRTEEKYNQTDDVYDCIQDICDYIRDVNEEEADALENFINDNLGEIEARQLLEEFIVNGIPLHQAPFWNNVDINKLESLYDKYSVNECTLEGIEQKMIMAEMYFIRLKHEPRDKFSSRSTGLNNLKDLPAKGKLNKENKSAYSNTPIRIGEMEVTNLNLTNNMDNVKELLDSYANNKDDREELVTSMLIDNPFDINYEPTNTESNNSKIIRSLIASIGYTIEKENENN